MTDTTPEPKKLSQFPAVTTLANTDLIVVIANGVNSTITLHNLIAAIAASNTFTLHP